MININKFYLFILSITLIISQASSSQDSLMPHASSSKDSLMSQDSSSKSLTFPISATNSSNKVDSHLTSDTLIPQNLETNYTNDKGWYFFSDSESDFKTDFASTQNNVSTPSKAIDQANTNNDLESLANARTGSRILTNISPHTIFSYSPHLILKVHSITDTNPSNPQVTFKSHNFTSWEEARQQLQTPLLLEESSSSFNPQTNLSLNKYINILKKVGSFALIANTEFSIASASWNILKGDNIFYNIIFLTSDFIYCTIPFLHGNTQTLRILKTMASPLVCQLISSLFISAGLLYLFIKYKDISPDIFLCINIFSNTLTGFTLTLWAACLPLMSD